MDCFLHRPDVNLTEECDGILLWKWDLLPVMFVIVEAVQAALAVCESHVKGNEEPLEQHALHLVEAFFCHVGFLL